MKPTQLKRVFLFRSILNKQYGNYTEVEINIITAIYLMNEKNLRCSGNTLFTYLSAIHRTPSKKSLLFTIRKLKEREMIRVIGKGAGLKINLSLQGKIYLMDLEGKLRRIRFTV